jgi:hypothetical protein
MVVSLFGESAEDQRDYRMGLAGLLAGAHSLRILAEQGLAPPADIQLAIGGMKQLFDQIPTWRQGERERLDGMLDNILSAAHINYGKNNG